MEKHTDDYDDLGADELRDLLRSRDRRLREEREANELSTAWASAVAEHNKACDELIERWRELFDMEMNQNGHWVFNREQTKLWTDYDALLNEHQELVRSWNKFVPAYNASLRDQTPRRGPGQPLHASEAQVQKVLGLRADGMSLRAIAAKVSLSLSTVRSIIAKPEREEAKGKELRRRTFNKEAAARYRARKRAKDALEKEINTFGKESARVLREAKTLGLAKS